MKQNTNKEFLQYVEGTRISFTYSGQTKSFLLKPANKVREGSRKTNVPEALETQCSCGTVYAWEKETTH